MRAAELETKLFVDLDGVLADLDRYVREEFGAKLGVSKDKDNLIWGEINARREQGIPVFSILEMMPDAQVLWDFVKPYHPNILTATGRNYKSGKAEKRAWVQQHLRGYDQIITVPKSMDKAKFAAPNHILIDDRMQSIGPWRKAGGIGILHKSAIDTIKQLRELGYRS